MTREVLLKIKIIQADSNADADTLVADLVADILNLELYSMRGIAHVESATMLPSEPFKVSSSLQDDGWGE